MFIIIAFNLILRGLINNALVFILLLLLTCLAFCKLYENKFHEIYKCIIPYKI